MKRISRELSASNFKHNISEIKKLSKSKIMAVVKADAYGHGIKETVEILSKLKIDTFAVATLSEAIKLRKYNKQCEILIFGIVDLDKLSIINENNLTISLVNYEYAKCVNELGISVKAHIKVNTGMNRVGELFSNFDNIKEMYNLNNIEVTGIYSHLSASDSLAKEDVEYSLVQINRFDQLLERLRSLNIDIGSTHLLASYGVLNYSNFHYDYIRVGIILYGLLSDKMHSYPINLKPVMTLKARVVSINEINANERISYANSYISNKPMKIATISIGYADGILRSLSNTNCMLSINNQLCPIIGLICMDQLVIDISNCDSVNLFDDVIIFDENILASEMAFKANTITNDVLSALNIRN